MSFSFTEEDVDLQHDIAQPRSRKIPPQAVVPFAEVAIVRANTDTDGAVGILAGPESKAFLREGRPFLNAIEVGNTVSSARRFTRRNSFRWTGTAATLAHVAEFLDTKPFWLIDYQRHVSENLAKAQPRPVLLGNQQTMPSNFTETCLDCERNG